MVEDSGFEFLIGGGSHPWNENWDPDSNPPPINDTDGPTTLNLEREVAPGDWEVIMSQAGFNGESMDPIVWDTSEFAGETVRLRMYDNNTGGWGHINVDNIRYFRTIEDVLSCDFDGDGVCDISDIDDLTAQGDLKSGADVTDAKYDLNGDAVLDGEDISLWLEAAGEQNGFAGPLLAGDADLNGTVDATDLNEVGISWQQDGKVYSEGDFDGDGLVNAADLNILGVAWQQEVAVAAAVPEPSHRWLAVVVGLLILTRFRASK